MVAAELRGESWLSELLLELLVEEFREEFWLSGLLLELLVELLLSHGELFLLELEPEVPRLRFVRVGVGGFGGGVIKLLYLIKSFSLRSLLVRVLWSGLFWILFVSAQR